MGDTHSADYLVSSWKMFLAGLHHGRQDQGTTFIRLLTPERLGENPAEIRARIEDFAANLLPELEMRLP
jgi:hypothetical protein